MEPEPHVTQRGSSSPGLLIGVHPSILSAGRIFKKWILLLKKEKLKNTDLNANLSSHLNC